MSHVVTAPLVIAKTAEDRDLYIYKGSPVPEGQSPDWLDRHLADGMIAGTDTSDEDEPAGDDDRPAGNASHEEWVAYAVEHGMEQDEAEDLSRNELRDRFPAE